MSSSAAKRERIVVPDMDGGGRFRIDPTAPMQTIVCIGCGCDEVHPCAGGCSWVAADDDAGVGLCSACAQKPLEELLVVHDVRTD